MTVSYATSDGTATTGGAARAGGQDYVARSGTLSFPPGETSKVVAVTVNADLLDEPDETFGFTLSGATTARASPMRLAASARRCHVASSISRC